MKTSLPFLFLFLIMVACKPNPDAANEAWWTESDRQRILSELDRTTQKLKKLTGELTESQWQFRESPDRWSIEEIVEHLEMQNQLHFREISVVAHAPQYIEYRGITEGQDEHFTSYATDATPGQSQWFLEPLGRFQGSDALAAFSRARAGLRAFVENTDVDLRKQFTFRTPVAGKVLSEIRIGQVRDLHQLLLTGIAHTDRHLDQVSKVLEHPGFPR
ncbi:MAG: DinB family protein [Roseivirga sp.]|nr:DinB family protein [Roseivirga sp.]